MSPAIRVENLSKKYIIGHKSDGQYTTLRDALTMGAKSLSSRIFHPFAEGKPESAHEEFWALRDVSFDIQQGDRVGVIGRNGAGKSTLLKILSRITEPTAGKISIRGRVASLLEVGTGFHPELTGRENVFLNGAILGMSRAEIAAKFDEIVAFAEVERFLDTPVKRYSSGMYVRLAFSVAAHLEPEILIVDEVLAVGDAQFQKKCIGKMGEVGKEGRTLIFVSHNMNAIEQLCLSAICLEQGKIKRQDKDVRNVIRAYFGEEVGTNIGEWANQNADAAVHSFFPTRFAVIDENGKVINAPIGREKEISICVEAEIGELDPALTFGFVLYDDDGTQIFRSYQTDSEAGSWPPLTKGRNKVICSLPKHFLNEGHYSMELIAGLYQRKWLIEPGSGIARVQFTVQGGLSESPYWTARRPGVLAPVLRWRLSY